LSSLDIILIVINTNIFNARKVATIRELESPLFRWMMAFFRVESTELHMRPLYCIILYLSIYIVLFLAWAFQKRSKWV